MTTKEKVNSIKKTARIAGFLLLIILIPAIFAQVFVPSSLIVPGDAAATANNIVASESLFRIGIVSELVIFLIEIVSSVLLYVLLKPVGNTLALVMMVSKLAMTAVHGINLLNRLFSLLLLSGADYLTVFETDQLHALVLLFLNAHSYGFAIGLVLFSLHTFVLGYLVFKSGYIPSILGVFLIIASFAYLIDSFAILFLTNYEETPVFLMLFIAIAELSFPLWLLVKGVDVQQWENRARESV